ncbi:MAG: carboxypeptidase regulatory-like domain-containing protein [Prolixibacteraceae bacterium]|nr:TonB-dependent receptor [Prolixibacteraceae bacterium]MDI9562927.1 carboxypeptidase regulatory-like domain-containing protein [Bacteroidota bacterium]NLS99862.1 TonB-dependent receptor [Bacteroidales bacterium]HOC85250.1 carboxypeptidase regulatory-like domain-containing protein [Prolixibacteraceae bacterium]HOG94902.1 carboxypeptidase regulatory-like domain-containing protein [Prolixibacteraceae bacterium]
MNTQVRKLSVFMLLLVLSVTTAFSQVTTSGMTGRVVSDSNEPLPGATVVAVHTPSGTQYGTITNAEGIYIIQGMRSGGPYDVNISFVGSQTVKVTDITLRLGENFVYNAVLKEQITDLGEVIITAGRNPILNSNRTGASMNVSSRELRMLPSISRGVYDFARLTPQASGNSFGSRDGRYNRFTIDGAAFNNNFGLSSSPLPGGTAQPISMDALEEVSVNLAPYDVRLSQFTGGSINAITKSGDNQFKGSVFSYLRPKSFTGSMVGDIEVPGANDRSNKVLGFTLGGPIVKNKLFFFVNGEYEDEIAPSNGWEPSTDGVANIEKNISRTTQADLKTMKDYLMNTYKYDPGDYMNFKSFPSQNYKILAKLDWNISDVHKFSLRYNTLKNSSNSLTNASSGPPGVTRSNFARVSERSIAFSNAFYGSENKIDAFSAELNSQFSSSASNKFLVSYTKTLDPRRTSNSDIFPFVEIYKDGDPYMAFGYELFSYRNQVINNTFSFVNNFTYMVNKHALTAGLAYDNIYVNNSYIREGTSFYRYNSMQDFMSNAKPAAFGVTYGYDGKAIEGVEMSFGLASAYLQDELTVRSNFKLTLGARFDLPLYHNKLADNPAISENLESLNGYKLNVGEWPNSQLMINPRVGFNWDVMGDRSLQVRGGTGLFSGVLPFVWFTNQPSSSGTVQSPEIGLTAAKLPDDFRFNPDMQAQLKKYPTLFPGTMAATLPSGSTIAEVSKDFKMPQIWRSNLAADIELPWNSVFTLEAIFTKDVNATVQKNINLPNAQTIFAGVDNRPRWTSKTLNPALSSAMLLDNSSKGYQASFTGQLTKNFSHGFSGMVAYTYNMAKDVTANPGSAAYSAWTSNLSYKSLNDPELSFSNFSIPHRVVAALSYRIEYAQHFGTAISLYYSGSSQGRATYAYSNDMNGDGASGDLLYVPKDANEITFATYNKMTPADQSAAFMEFVNKDEYLSSRKGKYAERFGIVEPWYNRLDVKVIQDVFTNIGTDRRGTLQFSLDIVNAANLINNEWGVYKKHGLANNYSVYMPLRYISSDVNGTPSFGLNATSIDDFKSKTEYVNQATTSSTWGMLFGIRFIF